MKTTKLLVALVALLTIGTSNGFAQRGMGRGMGEGYGPNQTEGKASYCHKIPNLTEEQKTQIEALRVKHMKSTTDLKNQMNEKRARLRTLESAENPNLGDINKTIDEITAIKATLMKNRAAHRAEISKLLSLWNQQGSSVQRGNHLVLPLNDSLLYVEPIYLQADQGQIPEIRLVVLSDGNELAYGPTFAEALANLRQGQKKEKPLVNESTTLDEERQDSLAAQAWDAYLEAEAAMQNGPDWETYGKAQTKLKEILFKLNAKE